MRAAVSLINGLGDQLIAWPTLRALSHILGPKLELWLGPGLHRALYRDVPLTAQHRINWVNRSDAVIDTNVPPDHQPIQLFISISTWGSPSVVELGKKLGAHRTIGLSNAFDETVGTERINMFDQLFCIAQHLRPSLSIESFAKPPRFSLAAERTAKRYLEARCAPNEPLLFVHPETKANKMWQRKGYERTLRQFLQVRPEYRVLVMSQDGFPLNLGPYQDRLIQSDAHFELALSLLAHADLFLGVDSCFLHAADLLRIPAVGLFGPTDPTLWGFRFTPNRTLRGLKEDTSSIEPDQVLESLLELAPKGVPNGFREAVLA